MAVRTPLVLGDDGLPQRLQAGDTLSSPSTTPALRAVINGETAAALAFGQPVYVSAAGAVKRGQANAKATAGIVGLVYDASIAVGASGNICEDGVIAGTTAQWDVVTGQTGGLTFNALYFLDAANVGKLTTTPPTATGQVNTLVGRALSATEMAIIVNPPILL